MYLFSRSSIAVFKIYRPTCPVLYSQLLLIIHIIYSGLQISSGSECDKVWRVGQKSTIGESGVSWAVFWFIWIYRQYIIVSDMIIMTIKLLSLTNIWDSKPSMHDKSKRCYRPVKWRW